MYQQILEIGEGRVPAVIEYTVEDGYCIAQRVWARKHGDESGPFDQNVTGQHDQDVIDGFGERLDLGHDAAIRQMDWLHGESVAAERAAFREAYA